MTGSPGMNQDRNVNHSTILGRVLLSFQADLKYNAAIPPVVPTGHAPTGVFNLAMSGFYSDMNGPLRP